MTVRQAMKTEKTDCAVVICGSLYLAGEIRPYIINKIKAENESAEK